MFSNPLKLLNISVFFQTQIFMLPVLLLFYQENGLTVGDYFLFQGIFSVAALIMEIPAGYIGDLLPRKRVLILSYSLFIARLLLWYLFRGYWIVLAGELLYAGSKAFFSGVSDGYIYDYLKTQGKTNRMLKRYGRMNFAMSVGTAIASLLGSELYATFGVMTLIVIELIFNTIALILLSFLPDIPTSKTQKMSMVDKYKDLYQIAKFTVTYDRLRNYVFYSAMAVAATMIFVWSFQPLMKAASIPAAFFGVTYFINHLFRAGAGYFLNKTMSFFTLKTLGATVYGLTICSFILAMVMSNLSVFDNTLSIILGFMIIVFICFSIAMQLSFTLSSVSRIHSIVGSAVRSTVVSINTMMSRLATAIVLIMFKFFLDGSHGITMTESFLIYMLIFMSSIYFLIKLWNDNEPQPN